MGIYFDNAATTLKKPDCVINAVTEALKNLGNSSRGAYEASMDASRLIYDTRVQLAALFHAGEPRQTAFTSNSTEALNTAILGLLQGSGHVIDVYKRQIHPEEVMSLWALATGRESVPVTAV